MEIDCIFCSPVSPLYSGRIESSPEPQNTLVSALPLSRTLLMLHTGREGERAEYWLRQGRGECGTRDPPFRLASAWAAVWH